MMPLNKAVTTALTIRLPRDRRLYSGVEKGPPQTEAFISQLEHVVFATGRPDHPASRHWRRDESGAASITANNHARSNHRCRAPGGVNTRLM